MPTQPIARTEFALALNQVCAERGIDPEVVLETIRVAIVAAYHKDYPEEDVEKVEVDLNSSTGEVHLKRGKKDITPPGFGRIASQTAKQVITQRIREAEKTAILTEYGAKTGTVVSGLVQRISGPVVTVNLGKAEGIMPPQEQTRGEIYNINERMKFYVVGVREGARGEEIIVSRSHPGLLEGLFRSEVPEISSGAVEVKAVAREAGSRSKIAVFSNQVGVDPVGSSVGQKGVRVQAVINELGDERIDVIAYSEDLPTYIAAALSPAKEVKVKINEEEKTAQVTAPDDQLSLAIGKEGQNVRLAAKLTGHKIDIQSASEAAGLPRPEPVKIEPKGETEKIEAKEEAAASEVVQLQPAAQSGQNQDSDDRTATPKKKTKENGSDNKTSQTNSERASPASSNEAEVQPE